MTKPTDATVEVTPELLPCPVCGEQPKWRGTRHDYARGIFRLQCIGETHLVQSYGADQNAAITAWNTRQQAERDTIAGGGDIFDDLAAAFGPVIKEAFPDSDPRFRYAVAAALSERVKERAHWFAVPATVRRKPPATKQHDELIEQAVQAAIDAGLVENGQPGIGAARHAARFIAEQREYWREYERAELADEISQIETARIAALATPAPGVVNRDDELTPEFRALSLLQKWETLTLHGLLGTNEPWIEHMRRGLSTLPDTTGGDGLREAELVAALRSALTAIGHDTLPIVRRAARIKIKAALGERADG